MGREIMVIKDREVMNYLGEIYRYSTQDITITFDVTTTSWTDSIVTFSDKDGTKIFEIENADITKSGKTISFSLSQTQTALLPEPYCLMMVNYTYTSGTKRNNSEIGYWNIYDNLHGEVI